MFLVLCPAGFGVYCDVRTQTLAYLHFQQRNRLRREFYAPRLHPTVSSHTCRSAHTSPLLRPTATEVHQRSGADRRGRVVQIQLRIDCATKTFRRIICCNDASGTGHNGSHSSQNGVQSARGLRPFPSPRFTISLMLRQHGGGFGRTLPAPRPQKQKMPRQEQQIIDGGVATPIPYLVPENAAPH